MSYNNPKQQNKYLLYFIIPLLIGMVVIFALFFVSLHSERSNNSSVAPQPVTTTKQVATSQPVSNSKELADVTKKVNGLNAQMNTLLTEVRKMSIDSDLKIPAITCTQPNVAMERFDGYTSTYLEARYKQDELATKALIDCEDDKRDIIAEKIKLETVKECNKAFAKGLRPAACFNN